MHTHESVKSQSSLSTVMHQVRMGRQFVTRNFAHGQIIELDRHASLDKALFEIKVSE